MPIDVRCTFAGRVGSRRDFAALVARSACVPTRHWPPKSKALIRTSKAAAHRPFCGKRISSGATWRNGSQEIGDPAEFGAPRPMKMGTTVSPWGYDAVADQALRPDSLRWPAILRYVLLALIDAPHFGDGATTSSASTLTFALTEFEMKQ
jgi:hypothetical protein